MRTSTLFACLVGSSLVASSAFAQTRSAEPEQEDIGTRPAQIATSGDKQPGYVETERPPGTPSQPPVIAEEPPPDWAVLHAGVRPHLGTFGGIGVLALAHERVERFYGIFSLSLIRNDAGTHYGG